MNFIVPDISFQPLSILYVKSVIKQTPISIRTTTTVQHNNYYELAINVIVLKVLPCKGAIIDSMGYQQVVMCTDDMVM